MGARPDPWPGEAVEPTAEQAARQAGNSGYPDTRTQATLSLLSSAPFVSTGSG
jgi:hypothetical protein